MKINIVEEAKENLKQEERKRAMYHAKTLVERKQNLEKEIQAIDESLNKLAAEDFSEVPRNSAYSPGAIFSDTGSFARFK